MSIEGLLGRKIGMTTLYWEDGRTGGVTLVEVGPCVVTQIRTAARDGYEAVQVGFQEARHVNKPEAGHLARSGGRYRHLQEFSVEKLAEYEVGQSVGVSVFQPGDIVSVQGISKGRGFAGGVRRYGFAGGPKTHGQSDRHRAPGSVGAGSSPGRVWKGTRMAGHMGAAKVTNDGLRVALVDEDRNVIAIVGSVPGPKNGVVRIELKKRGKGDVPPVLFGILPLEEEAPESAVAPPAEEAADVADDAEAVEAADDSTDESAEETTADAVEIEPEAAASDDAEAAADESEEPTEPAGEDGDDAEPADGDEGGEEKETTS